MYIELKTERLLLRPLTIADLDAVHAYAGDPENARESCGTRSISRQAVPMPSGKRRRSRAAGQTPAVRR